MMSTPTWTDLDAAYRAPTAGKADADTPDAPTGAADPAPTAPVSLAGPVDPIDQAARRYLAAEEALKRARSAHEAARRHLARALPPPHPLPPASQILDKAEIITGAGGHHCISLIYPVRIRWDNAALAELAGDDDNPQAPHIRKTYAVPLAEYWVLPDEERARLDDAAEPFWGTPKVEIGNVL